MRLRGVKKKENVSRNIWTARYNNITGKGTLSVTKMLLMQMWISKNTISAAEQKTLSIDNDSIMLSICVEHTICTLMANTLSKACEYLNLRRRAYLWHTMPRSHIWIETICSMFYCRAHITCSRCMYISSYRLYKK